MKIDLMADASAALGIIGRSGFGKLRHIDTSCLRLQQESIKEKITMGKVLGTENPADMNTKGLNGELIDKYVRMLNMEHREGRADLAPEVCKLVHELHCQRFNSTNKMITKKFKTMPQKKFVLTEPQINKPQSQNKEESKNKEEDLSHVGPEPGIEPWQTHKQKQNSC